MKNSLSGANVSSYNKESMNAISSNMYGGNSKDDKDNKSFN